MKRLFLFLLLAMGGCFQVYDQEDEDLRIVPVTNNPHIVPEHGSGLPMGGGAQTPY